MKRAKFGPAGSSLSFPGKSSVEMPLWLRTLGLDVYEYQCGKGVNVGEQTARTLGARAAEEMIALSLHAPYFINLANPDPESQKKTVGYIVSSCRAADWMGAGRVVLHAGSLMKRTRREALEIAKASLREALSIVDGEGLGHIALCPETMGKIGQLGDLDEVLELCQVDGRLIPCVDFGHLYARSLGAEQGEEATERILDKMASSLGEDRARSFHSHFSKIEFSLKGGEVRHLVFNQSDYGPEFTPLGRALACRGWDPVIICESAGTQAEDAVVMKRIYESFLDRPRLKA